MVGYKSFLPPLSVQDKIIHNKTPAIPPQAFTSVEPNIYSMYCYHANWQSY